jgi:superkiller protein 3
MYMTNGDLELASEALDKAQALDPDYVSCWLGQGLIDYIKGNRDRASDVFEHSYTISRGRDMLAKLLHGLVTYEKSVTEESLKKGRFQTLESAILALHKYHMTCPDDTLAVFLQGSLLERASSHGKGIEDVESLAKLYEDRFEVSEGEEDLISFAKAKALLARLQLAENEYQNAVENASFVLSLLEDDDTRPIIRSSRLSALVTAGIASYFLGHLDQSLQYFERALVVTDTDQAVVILLVQVLWAQGGEHERSAALDYLFTSIGSKGSSVDATVVLGVIGLLGDVSLVEPATEELENLPIGALEKDHKNHVQEVLSLLQKDIGPWQRAAFLWPTNYEIWKNIEPEIALKIAEAAPQNVNFLELSKAYACADNSLRGAQRSIFFAPWAIHGWRHLSDVLQS